MIECDAGIRGGSNSTEIFLWIFVLQTEEQSFVNFFHALKRSKHTNRLTLVTYSCVFFFFNHVDQVVTEISEFRFREKLVENLSGSLPFRLFSVQNRLFLVQLVRYHVECSAINWSYML